MTLVHVCPAVRSFCTFLIDLVVVFFLCASVFLSDEGEPQPSAVGSACRWESECCNAVGAFLETAMKKRYTLAGLSAEESDSSPLLSPREHDSDSDGDSSVEDCTLARPPNSFQAQSCEVYGFGRD